MSFFDGLRYRLKSLLFSRDTEEERRAEIEFHLSLDAGQEEAETGPASARLAARRRFGNVTAHRQDLRGQSRGRWIDAAVRELRFAIRGLRRSPGFLAAAVLTQGIGIAVFAGVAALAYGVLLKPLPYSEPDRLVMVEHVMTGRSAGIIADGRYGMSDGLYLEYAKSGLFDGVGLYVENDGVALTDRDDPVRLRVAVVTASLLDLLRVRPAVGRLFSAERTVQGDPPRVMISYSLWKNRYGGDSGIVGRTLELNRRDFVVTGVMPEGFGFPSPTTAVWYDQQIWSEASFLGFQYAAVARLPEGRTPADVAGALQRVIGAAAGNYPDATESVMGDVRLTPLLTPLGDAMVRDVQAPFRLLVITALFVLLITWANLANLVLVRSERSRRDVALGRALGGTEATVTLRVVAELLVIAVAAGLLGLVVAATGIQLRFGFGDGQIPRLGDVRADAVLLGIVVVLSIGFVGSLAVVARSRLSARGLLASLSLASPRATDAPALRRTQLSIVAGQVALAGTLLVGALAMIRTVEHLRAAPLGFEPENRVTVGLDLPYSPYSSYLAGARFYGAVLDRLRAVPGVEAAEAVNELPLTGSQWSIPVALEAEGEVASSPTTGPLGTIQLATPGYFAAMGMALISGRAFDAGDLADGSPNVIVSAALARRMFGGADPIGRRVRGRSAGRGEPAPWHTIVGLVSDVPGATIPEGPRPTLYFPILDDPARPRDAAIESPYSPGYLTIVIRSTRTVADLVPSIRAAVRAVDPKVPVTRVGSLELTVADSMARVELTMRLLLIAAGAAVILGVIGVYAVIAFVVSQRTREFGIRLAVGSTPRRLRAMVVRQGLGASAAGLAIGLIGGWAFGRLMESLLYGVRPGDPASLVGATAVLLVATAAASLVPAYRASRVDLTAVLKAD